MLIVISIIIWFVYFKKHQRVYWWVEALVTSFIMIEFFESYREGSNNIAYIQNLVSPYYYLIIIVTFLVFVIVRFRKNIKYYFQKRIK
jgi:O-antigen ligase